MTPTLSIYDHRYRALTNSVLGGKRFEGNGSLGVLAPYFCDLRFGKFCFSSFRPDWFTSFIVSISHVLGVGTKRQVRGVTARCAIARMHDEHTIGNCSIVKFVTIAVRLYRSAINAHLSVTGRGFSAHPQPTAVVALLAHFIQKSLSGWTAVVVSVYEANGMAFFPSMTIIITDGYLGWLSTTALTVTVRGFFRGIIERHDDLQSLCQASGLSQAVAGALLLGSYTSNYSAT